jgi:hypothetical protein
MEIRRAYLQMIKAFPGGWDSMSGALGMSKAALENRIYERKGQGVLVETAIQMQAFSGTTHFAEAISQQSGGCFIQLPEIEHIDRDDLLSQFNVLYAELGVLSQEFNAAVADGEIDSKEKRQLTETGTHLHQAIQKLLALSFSIYCRPNAGGEDE